MVHCNQTMPTEFKAWLHAKMEIDNWTQETMGKKVGVSHVTVGKWLKGVTPNPRPLRRLADVTRTDPIDLFIMVGYLRPEDGKLCTAVHESPAVYEADSDHRAISIYHEIAHWPGDMLDLLQDQIKFVLKPRIKKPDIPSRVG